MDDIQVDQSTSSSKRTASLVVASILVAGAISGAGAYAYQKNEQSKSERELQSQIESLKNDLATAKELVASPTPIVGASPSPAVDVYANWKTFSNSGHGYALKYPKEWIEDPGYADMAGGVSSLNLLSPARVSSIKAEESQGATSRSAPSLRIGYYGSPSTLPATPSSQKSNAKSLLEWLKAENQKRDESGNVVSNILSFKEKTMAGYQGYEVEEPDMGNTTFWYLEQKGRVYTFVFNEQDAAEIIDTFKVL